MLTPLVLAALFVSPIGAQSNITNFAVVRGTVMDRNHRAIPNARVSVYGDVDVRETTTDEYGRYVLLTLLPGAYQLYAGVQTSDIYSSGGASCYDQNVFELDAGVEYQANFQLSPGCL